MTGEHIISESKSRSDWSGDEEKEAAGDEKKELNGVVSLMENGETDAGGERAEGEGESEDEEELRCGLGVFSPAWMQMFASKQTFLVIFCITWVLQGMYYTYFVSVITTIEKLFRIQSKTTGIIMSATEIGQIGSSLLLTYFGGQGHRPKWIAWGMVLFAISSFSCSVPHFLYHDQLIHANEVIYSGAGGGSAQPKLCRADFDDLSFAEMAGSHPWESSLMADAANKSWTARSNITDGCVAEIMKEQEEQTKITKVVMAIFFISLLGVGMGQTAVYTLGIPYIDDNVATRESPLYFGELY